MSFTKLTSNLIIFYAKKYLYKIILSVYIRLKKYQKIHLIKNWSDLCVQFSDRSSTSSAILYML